MALNSLKTRLKKFFKYLGLGGLTILLTVLLGLRGSHTVAEMTKVDAAVPDSPAVQVSLP
jgi:hypothetical protein